MVLFLCPIFTQSAMNDPKIERSDEHWFGRKQFLAKSIENFISHENKSKITAVTHHGPKFTKH